MTTQATTQRVERHSKNRSGLLLTLALGAALAGVVAMAGTAQQAEAALAEKIVFTSNRTVGTGVNNPTGDYEIFRMNADGTAVKQLTFNKVDDIDPILSPDGTKVAYTNEGIQTSNPEEDHEIYVMNTLDGTAKKNLTNNGPYLYEEAPVFSPDGTKIAYTSRGGQPSNEEGDEEIYRMNALDGKGKKNLSNNGPGVDDYRPVFSLGGKQIAYTSLGAQPSNPEGDFEVYVMNALDGTGQTNLSNNVAVDGVYVTSRR